MYHFVNAMLLNEVQQQQRIAAPTARLAKLEVLVGSQAEH